MSPTISTVLAWSLLLFGTSWINLCWYSYTRIAKSSAHPSDAFWVGQKISISMGSIEMEIFCPTQNASLGCAVKFRDSCIIGSRGALMNLILNSFSIDEEAQFILGTIWSIIFSFSATPRNKATVCHSFIFFLCFCSPVISAFMHAWLTRWLLAWPARQAGNFLLGD